MPSRLGRLADAFLNNESRWLWVPAFAGTTHGKPKYSISNLRSKYRWRSGWCGWRIHRAAGAPRPDRFPARAETGCARRGSPRIFPARSRSTAASSRSPARVRRSTRPGPRQFRRRRPLREIPLLGADRQHAQRGHPQQAQCRDALEQGNIIFDRHAGPVAPLRRRRESLARIVSRHQLVATGFRHQYLGIGGIFLDLLAQPIDVGFQGVRGDA